MNLDDIIKKIPTNTPKCCVYMAIGSAAHMAKQNNKGWSIEPQYEQQFPRFLRSLKSECPCEPVHIILIDPILENPPFIVCDIDKKFSNNWSKVSEDIYHEDICNITVYALRLQVKYGTRSHNIEGAEDITENLVMLNTLAMQHNWFVVVQDYSGNNIADVGIIFKKALKGHLDHIIYGLNVGYDGGCYLDISQPNCDFFYIIDDIQIKVVISYDKDFIKALEHAGDKRYVILSDQRRTYLDIKKHTILKILASLRSLHNEGAIKHALPKYIIHKYIDIVSGIESLPVMAQYEIIFRIIRQELSSIGVSSSKVDEIVYRMHTAPSPYNWIDIVSMEVDTYHNT